MLTYMCLQILTETTKCSQKNQLCYFGVLGITIAGTKSSVIFGKICQWLGLCRAVHIFNLQLNHG